MLAILLLASFQSADTVRYEVSFPNASHHEAQVLMTVAAHGRDTLEFRMSRSSPGRYATHEFAKNVYNVKATDGSGHALSIIRHDPYSWKVAGHNGTVKFSYTLFADRAGGTYTGIDNTHAHMNIPATFAWTTGDDVTPIRVHFKIPDGSNWRAATQLIPTGEPMTFAAPHLQYFMDSPTELSDFMLRKWTVAGPGGRVDTLRLAIHHQGTAAEVDSYVEMAKKVVAEEIAIYGETARYDNGVYTFIADYLPWASGDGMEHRNSTIISSTGSLARSANGLLGTLAHEFFHSWNVERIRPVALEPFNFTRANPSDALWFAEGFTQYYGPLAIRRAGLSTDARFAATVGGTANAVINSTARLYGSPMEMSLRAPFVDASSSIDPTNFGNIFLSYYTWGAGVALGLDLSIRSKFPGKNLDDFMRLMWQRFGVGPRYEIAHPYTVDDIERTLGEYTGDTAFAKDFFGRYVRGSEAVDYAGLLKLAGFDLVLRSPNTAYFGPVQIQTGNNGVAMIGNGMQVGSPAYESGLERGDELHSVAGQPVTDNASLRAIISSHAPGDEVEVSYTQRGERRTTSVKLMAESRLMAVPVEENGGALTAAQRSFRGAWLASRAK